MFFSIVAENKGLNAGVADTGDCPIYLDLTDVACGSVVYTGIYWMG